MSSSLTQLLSRHREVVADFSDADLPSLPQALSQVADPRDPRGVRYVFTELLLVCTAAVISGASTLLTMAEWAADAHHRRLLPGLKTVPSVATIHRLMAKTDAAAFDEVMTAWIRDRVRATARKSGRLTAVAVDGKEVRGAKNAGGTRTFLMAALDHRTGTVIGQEPVGEKTNEIPHLPLLLDQLGDLDGTVITADALHTLTQQAQAITSRGGHYLFTVKTNAKTLHTQISQAGWARRRPQHRVREKAHGRISTWDTTVMETPRFITFPEATQIIRIHRSQTRSSDPDDKSAEFVYAITSLPRHQATPAQLSALLRGHWGIENRLHWIRDTTYQEDASQVRTGAGAHMMASLRNLAISLHRLAGQPNISATTRHYARHPELATELTGL